jgi:hypothetical protein
MIKFRITFPNQSLRIAGMQSYSGYLSSTSGQYNYKTEHNAQANRCCCYFNPHDSKQKTTTYSSLAQNPLVSGS